MAIDTDKIAGQVVYFLLCVLFFFFEFIVIHGN